MRAMLLPVAALALAAGAASLTSPAQARDLETGGVSITLFPFYMRGSVNLLSGR